MTRFPFGIPTGWFHVLYDDELPGGEVRRLRYLDREMVAFRDESGAARVLDAYCPHLGAHLGHGGDVVDGTLRCPFHGWRWAGDGSCAEIPYAKRIPPRARIHSHPVAEVDGRIYVWHDAEGSAPWYEIPHLPEVGSPDWTSEWVRYRWTLRTQPQEIMENGIDWPHFTHVHQMAVPEHRSDSFEGALFRWNVDTRYDDSPVAGSTDELHLRGYNWGLGYCADYYTGASATLSITTLTPLDAETTEICHAVIGRKDGRSEGEVLRDLKAQMDEQAQVFQQDFEIWEHKRYRPEPTLCAGDGPIPAFRRWAAQFYPLKPDAS